MLPPPTGRPRRALLQGRPTAGLVAAALLAAAVAVPVAATLAAHLEAPRLVGPGQEVGPFDAGDPDVVVVGPPGSGPPAGYRPGTAVVFATQGAWRPDLAGIQRFAVAPSGSGWSVAGPSAVGVALDRADAPRWVDRGAFLQAPGVFAYGGRWVLFFSAHLAPAPGAGPTPPWDYCVGVATAASLDGRFVAAGPGAAPLLCQDGTDRSTFDRGHQDGGVIDPSPFVDPSTGAPYLLFKTGNEVGGPPARLWSVPLDPSTGTTLAPGAEPRVVLSQQAGTTDTIENPDLVAQGGTDVLYYATGSFSAAYRVGKPVPPLGTQLPVAEPVSYGETFARCDGPTGPCHPSGTPLLATDGGAGRWGPGGGTVFVAATGRRFISYGQWSSRCANYLYCPPGTGLPDPPPFRGTWFAPLGDVTAAGAADLVLAADASGAAMAAAGLALLVSTRRRRRGRIDQTNR